MNTPIADFINNYTKSDISRLHMPGHKGKICQKDITEVNGADSLYEANGIIAQSEKNATEVFGSMHTFYSAEGSSQCIKAMLMAAVVNRTNKSERPIVVAARNAHKAFIHAAALIDFDVHWLLNDTADSICSCIITAEQLKTELSSLKIKPCAVYITSPDYLGNITDIKALSAVCREFCVPLLVDNAHGAYLRFTDEHPIQLGADMCCDSAHKTLPVLTGGAYLHINNEKFLNNAKDMLAVFGSTSPSYLILSSLDNANKYMAESFKNDLERCINQVKELKACINDKSDEKLKITIDAEEYGLSGAELSEIMRKNKIECEYSDKKFVVLMFSPFNSVVDFKRVKSVLVSLKKAARVQSEKIKLPKINQVMTIKEAYFSLQKEIDVENAENQVCGFSTVSCPPAIPIATAGEIITKAHIELFKKYNIKKIKVIAD